MYATNVLIIIAHNDRITREIFIAFSIRKLGISLFL